MKGTRPFPITQKDVLAAYACVEANKGVAGVDHQTLDEFGKRLDDNTYKIANRMSSGSYHPLPVLAVVIPKKDGGERTLGIPTISDRVAQTVVKMRLEPIFEKFFHNDSYGFRPGKSAHQAIAATRKRCWQFDWVVEFDICKMFDCIPHHLIMDALRFHKTQQWILLYVERWLKAPLQKADGSIMQRTAGVPQGGPLSPLLANLFMHYVFDVWMKRRFHNLSFCRYADDALVHCRSHKEAVAVLRALTGRLAECGLEIHPDKTSIVYCRDSNRMGQHKTIQFVFLGYAFRPRRSRNKRGENFTSFLPAMAPSAAKAVKEQMRNWKLASRVFFSLQDIAKIVRPHLQGWMNYFCCFYKMQFSVVAEYFDQILLSWAMRKFKRFKRRKKRAAEWLSKVATQSPDLFPHWKAGFHCNGR